MHDVRSRLVETVAARAACLRCGDLEGYDVLTAEVDSLLDQFPPRPRLPSDRDGHTAPRAY